MAYYDLIWTRHNEDHVGQHGVTFAEFVEVVEDPLYEEIPHRFGSRAAFWGWTSTGRFIIAVVDVMEDGITATPVTAYEVKEF